MTWRDNLRAASSEDGFIIAGGSGASMIPQNTNWHDNYMNSFTENGIKIANLKDAVTQVSELPETGDEGALYYLTGSNPGMYYYEGNDWVLVGDGGVSDFNDLTNRPKLNDSVMTGNTNIINFTGTNGTSAGAQGLVPAPAATDADKFLKSDGTWATAGGGGPTVVQTTGTSTADVMSQNAVTNLLFNNNNTQRVQIGDGAGATNNLATALGAAAHAYGNQSIAAGFDATASGMFSIAIGAGSSANATSNTAMGYYAHAQNNGEASAFGVSSTATGVGALALGAYSTASSIGAISFAYCNDGGGGVVNFGPFNTSYGYNETNYRLLTGVHDGVNTHDAATVGQISQLLSALNSALGTSLTISNGVITNGNNANNSSADPSVPSDPSGEPGPEEQGPDDVEAPMEG